jgi:hypothetical protein
MARVHVFAAILALPLVATLGSAGCGTQCDRNPNEPPVVYKDGLFDPAHGTYFSSDEDGPFLDFPPGRTYRFFHGLGGKPEFVYAWLSFSEFPTPPGEKGEGFVEAAGNQVTFEHITCEYVDVRNDTCAGVRIRVAATAPDPGLCSDAGAPSTSPSDAAAPSTSNDAGDARP